MNDLNYLCPLCRTTLAPVRNGDFDTWECRDGHGMGLTITEAYGHFQDDEIRAIWNAAKSAPQSPLRSPALGKPMVAVTVMADDDEVDGNQGPGTRLVTLDVSPEEQFLWFHIVDFRNMPTDLPNPAPSAEAREKMERLRAQSVESVQRDLESKDDDLGRLGHRFGSRAAALLGLTGLTKRLGAAARRRMDEA